MTEYQKLPGYHWFAFQRLHQLFEHQIRYVLVDKYAELRRETFLRNFTPNEFVESEAAWAFANELLATLETEMQNIISVRSVVYWTHLYRRLGVMLSPDHESNTDPVTVGLVRQIAELAIQKFGALETNREFGKTDKLSPDRILSGWMKKGFKHLDNDKKFYKTYCQLLRSNPTWVIRDFSKKDFISLYAIEGIAYQYWRLTALQRTLGKGSKIKISHNGDWEYVEKNDFRELIQSVDRRSQNISSLSSLIGIWIDQKSVLDRRNQEDEIFEDSLLIPIYNISRAKLPDGFEVHGVQIKQEVETNFFPFIIGAGTFFNHHEFMRKEFVKKRGYDFNLMVSILAALSSLSIVPHRALTVKNEEEKSSLKLSSFIQTLDRGYHVYEGTMDNFLNILINRMMLIFQKQFDRDEVSAVISSISLSADVQQKIAPWSNGPRSIVLPAENFHLIDLASLPALLSSIFVFMIDEFGDSGTVFEELFRQALGRRGMDVTSGKLYAKDGSYRELDAGVLVEDKVFLFECVSIERPLDYEIGKHKTLNSRKDRLIGKIEQAKSLKSFLLENPKGTNYDFTGVAEFEWFVVSPFIEWIWSKEDDLWMNKKTPRILAPEEVFDLLGVAN